MTGINITQLTTTNRISYRRQRFLLSFIAQLSATVTGTDLQKLVFLYTKESGEEFYDFLPYKYGPYSFQLREDLDILAKRDYIQIDYNNDSTRIKIMSALPKVSPFNIHQERGDSLIRMVYSQYPYYAINSVIADRILNREESLKQIAEKERLTAKQDRVLFTIGYEGRSVESFINALIDNNISLLCDIRRNAISRKFGFSKGRLKYITSSVGITYTHLPQLGIESSKRNSLSDPTSKTPLFEEYSSSILSNKNILESLYSLYTSFSRVAIMCFENDETLCHRGLVRKTLTDTYGIESEVL